MAAKKTDEAPPAAAVRTQEYAVGIGWEVGQLAPESAYRAYGPAGAGAVTGPVVPSHPGGHARLIVAKGALVTEGVRRELDEAAQDGGA